MRRTLTVLVVVSLVLSLSAPAVAGGTGPAGMDADEIACEYPLELTDATGEQITLEEEPESIVALQASDAQTVFEIGAEDRLVGMPDSPATADLEMGDREAVTDGYELITERVIELDPDVVLAANITTDETVETLRDAGLTVYHFHEAESIDDVRDNVVRTGGLTGECDGATETADWMDDQLEIVERTLEDVDRPLAYYAMGDDGTTAGTGTFVHEVLTTAGVENVAERAGIVWYNELPEETLIDEDPDWIIHSDDAEPEEIMPDAAQATTAYENGNVIAVDANQLNQPAPQVVYAVLEIVEAVHPDAYEEAAEEVDADDSEDADDADDEDSIPGFGIPVAVAAVLAAVGLLAGRR